MDGMKEQTATEWLRDSWKFSCPLLLFKQCHQSKLPRPVPRQPLKISRVEAPPPLQQPVPVLNHPYKKKIFADIKMEPPVIQFVLVASCLGTGRHCRVLGLIFALFLQIACACWCSSSPFFSSPNSLNLFSSLIISVALYWTVSSRSMFLFYWEVLDSVLLV